jgi:hypothetical protein
LHPVAEGFFSSEAAVRALLLVLCPPKASKKTIQKVATFARFPQSRHWGAYWGRAMGRRWHAVAAAGVAFAVAAVAVAADRGFPLSLAPEEEMSMLQKVVYLMSNKDGNSYQHVWPVMQYHELYVVLHFALLFLRPECMLFI